jgi:hypothetical protein
MSNQEIVTEREVLHEAQNCAFKKTRYRSGLSVQNLSNGRSAHPSKQTFVKEI